MLNWLKGASAVFGVIAIFLMLFFLCGGALCWSQYPLSPAEGSNNCSCLSPCFTSTVGAFSHCSALLLLLPAPNIWVGFVWIGWPHPSTVMLTDSSWRLPVATATQETQEKTSSMKYQNFWAAFSKFLLRVCENKTMSPPPCVQVNESFILI